MLNTILLQLLENCKGHTAVALIVLTLFIFLSTYSLYNGLKPKRMKQNVRIVGYDVKCHSEGESYSLEVECFLPNNAETPTRLITQNGYNSCLKIKYPVGSKVDVTIVLGNTPTAYLHFTSTMIMMASFLVTCLTILTILVLFGDKIKCGNGSNIIP